MRSTPLFEEYARHNGRIVDFYGWGLPLHFEGIIAEHRHVREKAGVFDCSHMGEFLIHGKDAIEALSRLVIGDMCALRPGKCRYSAILNEAAGIIDDCVAFKSSDEEIVLITNAGPLEQVAALLDAHVPGVRNISDQTAKIDVQGPRAPHALHALGLDGIEKLAFWTGMHLVWKEVDLIVTRAGYTGELGYELYMSNEAAAHVWRTLMTLPEVMPCGLGARDTLRTEMGYPLSGQDVDETRTPLEAGMDRFISWETSFPGKAQLETQQSAPDHMTLVALRSEDRRAPRHGYLLYQDSAEIGEVTSGVFGPTVGCGVGLGYVPVALARPGTTLQAGPRGMNVRIEAPPIYKQASGRDRVEL